MAGKAPFSWAVKSITPHGTYLQAVGSPVINLRMKFASIRSSREFYGGTIDQGPGLLEEVNKLIVEHDIVIPVDQVFGFTDVIKAHEYAGTGKKRGSIAIVFR